MAIRIARRFGLMFEFDTLNRGSLEQETFIRGVVSRHQKNVVFARILWLLASTYKQPRPIWSKALPISWQYDIGANGWSYPALMVLNKALTPGDHMEFAFLHELGHLIGRHLFMPIDKTEPWADEFAYWVLRGSPAEDETYKTIVRWKGRTA